MKIHSRLLALAGSIAILAGTSGCVATRPNTERLLTAAGFKSTTASTPRQKEHLRTLPANKVSLASLNRQAYYVYADSDRDLLFVGRIIQYRVYQRMRRLPDPFEPVTLTPEQNAGWGIWGSLGPRGMW